MMEFQCESVTILVSDLYTMYKEGRLVKARIQRKKRWVELRPKGKAQDTDKETNNDRSKYKTNNEDFIHFIFKTKHTVNPLLLVERIDDNKKKNIIIDGNNRVNAIISFIECPLKYLVEIVPKVYTKEVETKLVSMTLPDILDCRDFKKFCNKHGLMEYYKENAANELMDTEFDKMKDVLYSYKFMDIKVLVIRFENINESKIKEIYEGVNCGGVKLTRQEILASTTSLTKYTRDEIELYPCLDGLVSEYYNEMDANEVVNIEREHGSLTLFEVLIGFQRHCSKEFTFISDVGDGDIDVIFKCYEIIYKDFDKKIDSINEFFNRFIQVARVIKTIQDNFFNTNINHSSTDKYKLHLKKNAFAVVFTYLYKNLETMNENELHNNCKRLLLYHELCNMIKCKETKTEFDGKNELGYVACSGCNMYKKTADGIMAGNKNLKIPTNALIRKLLFAVNSEDVVNGEYMPAQKPPKRSKLSRFKVLMLCLYFNRYVPSDYTHALKNVEHIVPWSVDEWTDPVNLDRLGNIVLIDENTNKSRGNRPLTDSFIQQHKLYYYNYPSEMDYKLMQVKGKTLGQVNAYEKICQEREKKYIECVLDSLNL